MSEIAPVSLFTAITDTTATLSRSVNTARMTSGSTDPAEVTGTTVPPTCSTQCNTAWCSDAPQTAVPPVRRVAPRTAALSPSVPPLVKITSPGRHPMTSATTSRASSITWRASRAKRCEPDGLAYITSPYLAMASRASERRGDVAA